MVVLQHPRERDVAIGTARMAKLCLPNAELHVGLSFEDRPDVVRVLADPARPACLLYPGPDAIDLADSPPQGPRTLVVLDGTWAHSRKLLQANPRVAALPRYAFEPARPSEYRIRREPRATYVSTIEALASVLGVLEGDPERFQAMLVPFRRMIDTQIRCARLRHDGRYQRARGPKPPTSVLPPALAGPADRVVCVAAEANAWPAGTSSPDAGRHELVQWVAHRSETQAWLDLVVEARAPLAPGTLAHTGLARVDLAGARPLEELMAAWAAFLRPDDVVCAWGPYPASVFRAAGGQLPGAPHDLRRLVRSHAAPPFGGIETWLERLSATPRPTQVRGRAGRRLAQTAALLEALRDDDTGLWRKDTSMPWAEDSTT